MTSIEAFLSVVDHGSIQAAASDLAISRSTLRHRLDRLERTAGRRLLVRTAQGCELTPSGRTFERRARAFAVEARLLLAPHRFDETEDGQLTVRVPLGLPPEVSVMALRALWEQAPGLRLRLDISSDRLLEFPQDVDVVVCFGTPTPVTPCVTLVLAHFSVGLYGARDVLERDGRPATLDQLGSHRLLGWELAGAARTSLPLVGGGSAPADFDVTCQDLHRVGHLVASGLGLGLLPSLALGPATDPALERVLADEVGEDVPLRMLVPLRLVESPRVLALVRAMRQHAPMEVPALEDWPMLREEAGPHPEVAVG